MPKIVVTTRVVGNRFEVFRNFNEDLFRYLKPPRFLAEINRYDGTYEGAIVEVQFRFPFQALMQVRISDFNEELTRFTDQGVILPFGLRSWTHHHQVLDDVSSPHHAIIRDEIHYRSINPLTDILFYPLLFMQFYLRKPAYRTYFKDIAHVH